MPYIFNHNMACLNNIICLAYIIQHNLVIDWGHTFVVLFRALDHSPLVLFCMSFVLDARTKQTESINSTLHNPSPDTLLNQNIFSHPHTRLFTLPENSHIKTISKSRVERKHPQNKYSIQKKCGGQSNVLTAMIWCGGLLLFSTLSTAEILPNSHVLKWRISWE